MKPGARCLLCICLVLPGAGAADELGRLFHSPAERTALDAARRADRQRPTASAPAQVRIDGYVQGSGGHGTVWVNGEALRAGAHSGVPRTATPPASGNRP